MNLDNKTKLKLQLLVREAGLMVYAFHNASTGGFLNLPAEDFGAPQFKAAVEGAEKQGFKMIAVIALMSRTSPDGHALIEYEPMPGASERDVESARNLWRDSLIRDGIVRPETAEG